MPNSHQPDPKPSPLETHLSRGGVTGRRADELWSRLEASAVEPKPQRRFVPRMVWGAGVMAAAAASLLLMSKREPWVERGAESVAPALLEGTCGTAAEPCVVGQNVFLRILPASGAGAVQVTLVTPQGRTLVAKNVALVSGEATAVASSVIPTAEDVARGIDLESWRTPGPIQEDPTTWLASPTGVVSTLHLHVVQPAARP